MHTGYTLPLQPHTIEHHIQTWDVIARVRHVGVEERIFTYTKEEYENLDTTWLHDLETPGDTVYIPAMAYEFEVLEYLKGGSGNSNIWGLSWLMYGDSNTQEEARAAYSYYSERRDKRWDNREAIVFLSDEIQSDAIPAKHHLLGAFRDGLEDHSLSSLGGWYPSTSSVSGTSGAGDAGQFIISDPARRSGASGASDASTMGLSEFRQLIALSQSELKARDDSLMGFMYIELDPPPETGIIRLVAITEIDEVAIVWEFVGSNPDVTGYRLLRRAQADSEFIELTDLPSTGPYHYEDTDFEPSTKYIYRLRAYGANGDIADARIAITTVAELQPLSAATATPAPAATHTPTPEPTPTNTPVAAPEPTSTPTPEPTPTLTPTPPSSGVSGAIDTPTPTPTSVP